MTPDALQILESVHNYYSTAFSNLVLYTTAIMAVAGVLVPLAIQFYNSRAQTTERNQHSELIRSEIQKAIEELKTRLAEEIKKTDKIIDDKLAALEKRIDRKLQGVEAGTFHIQGTTHLFGKRYIMAFVSFCCAGRLYIDDENEIDIQKMLRAVTEECLPQMNSKTIEKSEACKEEFDKFLKSLEAYNINDRYTLSIRALKKAFAEAQKRQPPPPTATEPPK